MKIRRILYSTRFERAFAMMNKNDKEQIIDREQIFRENCFDSRLKTHKLKGRLRNYWSFSITHSFRIMFEFLEDGVAVFIDVGDHSIYR